MAECISKRGRKIPDFSTKMASGSGEPSIVPETEVPAVDEHGVPRELWSTRDLLRQWLAEHVNDIHSYIAFRGAAFDVVAGMRFCYRPGEGKQRDIVELETEEYLDVLEGRMTSSRYLFFLLHELGHLIEVYELDRAGKENHLSQYNYESEKVFPHPEEQERFGSLRGVYREFYNILDDRFVNWRALHSRAFAEHGSPQEKASHDDARAWYVDVGFSLYRDVGEGNGNYVTNPDPFTQETQPYVEVGEGRGNLRKLTKEDHERGVDFTTLENTQRRSSQFMNFFIKRYMVGLSEKDLRHPQENPEGKHVVDIDAHVALTKPLDEAYTYLLDRVQQQYGDPLSSLYDPAKLARYVEFMSCVIRVPVWKMSVEGKLVQDTPDLVPNVIPKSAIDQSIQAMNVANASSWYRGKMRDVKRQLGIKDFEKLSFFQLMDMFGEFDTTKREAWRLPLKHHLAERTRIIRKLVEPLYTLLCMLDDDFTSQKIQTNPEKSKGKSRPRPPEQEKKWLWKRGMEVRNIDEHSSHNGKRGIITDIEYDPSGNISSVQVEYFEYEKTTEHTSAMAESATPVSPKQRKKQWLGIKDTIFRPDENLKMIAKRGSQGESGKSPRPPKGYEFEDDEEPEKPEPSEDENKDDDEDEGEDENDDDKENQGKKKKGKKPKKEGKEDEPEAGETHGRGNATEANLSEKDLGEIKDPFLKALLDMKDQADRDAALQELAEAQGTIEYRGRHQAGMRREDLLRLLVKAHKETAVEMFDVPPEEVVKSYQEIEAQLEPLARQMSKAWIEIVNNITQRIERIRDKYFRTGKMDWKKAQRLFPMIPYGEELDMKLLYARFVERVLTELRPKMLRVVLLIDNSGSMEGNIHATRTMVMLLNASLRAFRNHFTARMQQVLGDGYRPDMDVVCDTQIWLFGSKHRLIRDFAVQDLGFLQNQKIKPPKSEKDQETMATLAAFQKIHAKDGGTEDQKLWTELLRRRFRPSKRKTTPQSQHDILKLIQQRLLTEIIIQISDGDINGDAISCPIIQELHRCGVPTMGLALGSGAKEKLAKRHGDANTAVADPAEELAAEFATLLKCVMKEQIEKPMEEILTRIEKDFA